VLSVLLAGIVGLNVVSLSLSASRGKVGQQIQTLEEENSALRARLAMRHANSRVASAAAALGMALPDPQDVSYRDATPESLRLTAQRLASGFGLGYLLAAAPPTTTAPAPTVAPATSAATAPPSTNTTATTTTTAATTTAPPAPATSTGTTPGGGVSPG
jgi:hypothetical protein